MNRLSLCILALCLVHGCTFFIEPSSSDRAVPAAITPSSQRKLQAKAFQAMEKLAAPPQFTVSRPAVNYAQVNVPHDHIVTPLPNPTLSLEELLDRWRTNRHSLIILVTQPTTNALQKTMMPSRTRL